VSKVITLDRITVSAWNGTDSVDYLYADFPQGWPADLVDLISQELVRTVGEKNPGLPLEIETDEIAWSA
jgi:hypothetical protein